MVENQKLQIINEIKQIERELYLKKSKLASDEAMEYGTTKMQPSLSGAGLDYHQLKDIFLKLIEKIGKSSTGGNSVEDINIERQR